MLVAGASAALPLQYSNPATPTTPTPGVVSNSTTLVGTTVGAPVAVHNVAAGSLTPTSTDAVNGSQLAATNVTVAGNVTAITNLNNGIANGTLGLVQQTGGSPGTGAITVGAATAGTSLNVAGTAGNRVIAGVAAGVAPTDAANVGQLTATNTNVAGNTTAITNLNNGTAGLVQQVGGAPGNGQLTVGAATGGSSVTIAGTGGNRTLTGLNAGVAGNDAVTVAQINGLTGGGLNAVQYDQTPIGGRSNTVTLAGGAPGAVRVTNVNAGALAPGSTDAVNGGQLATTNANVTLLTNGSAGAFQSSNAGAAAAPSASGANASAGGFGAIASGAGAVALGNGAVSSGTGSVALGQGSTDGGVARVVSVGGVGSERRITNVGPAVSGTDAVNLSQLQTAQNSFTAATAGLQTQLNQTNFDLGQVRRRANGGTAGAMAVAGLPQAFVPGKSMIGGAVGYWADQVAFAIGVSSIVGERTVIKAGGSISNQGVGGFNAGIGWQF